MLVTLYIIFLLVSAIYYFLTWNYKHWEKRSIPGPSPAFFVGNVPGQVTQKHHLITDFENIYNTYKGQYNFVGIFNMRQPQYFVLDGSLARDILINKFKNFHDNEFADIVDKDKDPLIGRNPFLLKGEAWKEKRSEITPAFTTMRIKAMYPVIEDVCERMKKYILREKKDSIEAREMAAKFTTDVVSSCIFGVDAGSFAGEKAPIREMGRKIMTFSTRLLLYFFAIQLVPSLRKHYRISFVQKDVEQFFVNVMKDSIDLRKKSKIDRMDYMHFLLELQQKKNLNELDMVAHAVTFFLDGFETSSVVLSFCLYELAKNQQAQEKLRKEIRETREKHEDFSYEVIHEMSYLEQVISEAMRLHPPIAFMSKTCTESCEVNLTETQKKTIEEGHNVVIPVFSIHRDPRNYEDPNDFIPERFDLENGGTKVHKDKGTFLPFGDGPRICLGMRFAQTQLKAAIVSVIRDFELTVDAKTPEPLVYNPKDIIPNIVGGMWLNYKEIK
ncbi:hypothetical protein DMENIID0001_037070 [Sergentomyia squamirostris]